MQPIAIAKQQVRVQARARREALSPAQRAAAAACIAEKVLTLPSYTSALRVALYMNLADEVDTLPIVQDVLARGKQLVLPRVNKAARCLDLFRVLDLERDLRAGVWGIREPDPTRCASVSAVEVDLVLVPGLAFDTSLRRVGYGGGYYDSLLRLLRPDCARVALAFNCQVVPQVPATAHDQAVTCIVTEARTYS